MTIAAILDGYYADAESREVGSLPSINSCRKALKRHIGDLFPTNINNATARRYAKERRLAGTKSIAPPTPPRKDGGAVRPPKAVKSRPVSDGTIIKDLITLRAALNWAEKEGWIDRAPLFAMPVDQPDPRDYWLHRPEAERLIAACLAPHVRLFVILSLHTAGRSGAILDLTWDQVDFATGTINLQLPSRRRTKKRRALVPMTNTARAALLEAHEVAVSDHVIEWRGEGIRTVLKTFKRYAADAGLPRCIPYTLRHTAATWMIQDGRSLGEVARYLGNTEKMVEKVYGHHAPDYLARAAAALDGYGNKSDSVA
jgi:integrase